MLPSQNQQVVLQKRPQGAVTPACFSLRTQPLPQLHDGDVLVRNIYLSCDPYMRGQIGGKGYKTLFALDAPIPARVVGQVYASSNPQFAPGDFVWGFLAWEEFTLVPGGKGLRTIDTALGPISYAISVLGMNGLTAYVGIVDIGKPRAGETVFVSAASGAVGQIAGQIARIHGARVVGSAGSDAKVAHLTDALGFDAAFNYKSAESLERALAETCPDGIDIYFDNVGGATLDAVLTQLNEDARIAVCGQISQYDNTGPGYGLQNFPAVLGTRALIKGFSVRNHMDQYDAVVPQLAAWMSQQKLRYTQDIVEGLENAPQAFIGMMSGENLGKRLVRISADPSLS